MSEIRDLALLNTAQRALAEASTVDEVKDLCDKAAAVRAYIQKARLGRDLVIEAATIRIRAERRLGQMLHEIPLANAAPGNQHTGPEREAVNGAIRLEDLGISKNESSRSQRIAELADDLFETYLRKCFEAQREPTLGAVLRLVPKQPLGDKAASKPTTIDVQPTTSDASGISRTGFATVLLVLSTSDSEKSDSREGILIDDLCRWAPGQAIQSEAHLYIWASGSSVPDALDVMDAWGFGYFGCMACVYQAARRDVPWHDAHHLLLLGTRGNLELQEAAQRSWLQCKRSDNDSVPNKVVQLIEAASPEPYLQLLGDSTASSDRWTTTSKLIEPTSKT